MSLKILGGKAGGQKLHLVPSQALRPTSQILKRKVFDAHQNLEEFSFIDLCAGTGAMGIEAWSRGANSILIEKNKKHFQILKKNVSMLESRFGRLGLEIQCTDSIKFLTLFIQRYSEYSDKQKHNTILYLDPPYENVKDLQKWISLVHAHWFYGQFWIESDRLKGIELESLSHSVEITKTYRHSDHYIAISNFTK